MLFLNLFYIVPAILVGLLSVVPSFVEWRLSSQLAIAEKNGRVTTRERCMAIHRITCVAMAITPALNMVALAEMLHFFWIDLFVKKNT